MSKFTIGVAIFVLAAALSAPAYAAGGRWRRRRWRRPWWRWRRPAAVAAVHTSAVAAVDSGGAHIGGGGAQFRGGGGFSGGSRGGAVPQFSGRSGLSRSAIQSGGSRGYAGRSYSGGRSSRSFANQSNRNNFAGRSGRFSSKRDAATRNFDRSGTHNTRLNAAGSQNRSQARTQAVRNTLNSRSVAGALQNRNALRNPHNRAGIVASAATAGRFHGRGAEAGGVTAMADTAGSARCSGRSPTTTFTTTPCGATTTTPRSGATATTTSMPECSRPMAMTISSATCRFAAAAARTP